MNGQHNKKEGILFRHLLLSSIRISSYKVVCMKKQYSKFLRILITRYRLFLDFKFVGADQRRRTPPQLSIRRFTSK